jgi:response regulator RpfG family c-di-GMP phosphodiesterase
MATILIVEEDGVLAWQMMRTLLQAGHLPILASYSQSALREAGEHPDVIVLDLELLDMPGEELLACLHSRPETAHIPVLAITYQRESALHLREMGRVAEVLRKPLSGVLLRETVDNIVATQRRPTAEALRRERQQQGNLIRHLLVEGSDPLVLHIARRVSADRTGASNSTHAEALTWADIADCAKREGLLDAEQARLLRRLPLTIALSAEESTA